MDIQAYIASGILEGYVLGISTPEENAEVEALASKFPEIKAEIEAIRASLESYIMEYKQAPPPGLKEKVLSKLEFLESDENTSEARTRTLTPAPITSSYRYWWVAASLTLLLVSIGANIWLYGLLNKTRQSLAEARVANVQMAQLLQVNQEKYTQASDELQVLRNPYNQVVTLKGLPETAPAASVVVYWNKTKNNVHLSIHQLPPPPAGKQYQLWAIVDGKPVDAGMLEYDKGLQRMKDIGKAQAFAITLEKKGGNPTPEGKMYVLGNV